ncbi:hypothetical protein Ae201684P_000461 [Aphanomyces euteiches]|nr:hypothetical protein Ae201684P_000461 [Aphanomyces euteiches]
MQKQNGKNRVIAYASQSLSKAQQKWISKEMGISEIECWGVVWATRKFCPYIDRRHFDIYTDHEALTWLFNTGSRSGNHKLARWAMEIQGLDYTVIHKPGELNGAADGLSRLAVCPIQTRSMRRVNSTTTGLTTPPTMNVRNDDESPGLDQDNENDNQLNRKPPVQGTPIELFDRRGRPTPRLYNEQANDPWIVALRAFLEEGAIPLDPHLQKLVVRNSHQYVMQRGIVCRYVTIKTPLRNPELVVVPVIPHTLVEEVLYASHASSLAGHLGLMKTRERIRRTAYWLNWQSDCKEYVSKCPDCNRAKGGRPWKQGPMQRMPIYSLRGPFGLVVVDALGPLPTTNRGHKYILVFADYFTRWVEAFPVPDLKTSTFARVFIDGVLCRFGIPDKLLTDRGSNFVSELATTMYTTLGIHKLASAPYHPQGQGLVERFNHTIVQMLKIFVNDHQTDWDTYLPRLLFAYRTAHHETLGDSPYFCLFGRDPTLPLDLAFLNSDPAWKSDDLPQYKRRLASSWKQTRKLVEEQLIQGQNKSAIAKSEQRPVSFDEQSAVWVYKYFSKSSDPDDHRTPKLATHWHGPYRVERKMGPNTYKIAIPTHPDNVVTVNVDRLEPFRGYYSRPYNEETPEDESPLEELTVDFLPRSSFIDRVDFGDGDVAYTSVDSPIHKIVDKRRLPNSREPDYLVQHVDGYQYLMKASNSQTIGLTLMYLKMNNESRKDYLRYEGPDAFLRWMLNLSHQPSITKSSTYTAYSCGYKATYPPDLPYTPLETSYILHEILYNGYTVPQQPVTTH